MGTDNFFHKRRSAKSLKRGEPKRSAYETVLIVCEGEKTEKKYLKGLCAELTLNTANIKVLGKGEDPSKIVECALDEYNQDEYDQVFCVFDKDKHERYEDALVRINAHRKKQQKSIPISGITSVPCFEYWLLLHYEERSKPYDGVKGKSAANMIISDLRKYIHDYCKGHDSIYKTTKDNLHLTIKRAKNIKKQQKKNKTDNPSTNFYELVEYLQTLKDR